MAVEFSDVNGADLSIGRLPVPAPLFNLLKEEKLQEAEKWLRANDDHPSLQPYRVTLFVQDSRFSTDLRPVSYFLRGPRQGGAEADSPFARTGAAGYSTDGREVVETADLLWTKWEKPPSPDGVPAQYPDTVDWADMIEIDLGDWREYLRAAQRHARSSNAYFCIGAPRYPLHWTCQGMAFLDDQEAHQHPDIEILDAFARLPGFDTRGNPID